MAGLVPAIHVLGVKHVCRHEPPRLTPDVTTIDEYGMSAAIGPVLKLKQVR